MSSVDASKLNSVWLASAFVGEVVVCRVVVDEAVVVVDEVVDVLVLSTVVDAVVDEAVVSKVVDAVVVSNVVDAVLDGPVVSKVVSGDDGLVVSGVVSIVAPPS